ncbi:MAG: tetratricopeptide repeat protein [Elusimicrobia bacterium]|nr:tetratricopeptide repeat protein [Elusimicrobiota bacterium]
MVSGFSMKNGLFFGGFLLLIVLAALSGYIMRNKAPSQVESNKILATQGVPADNQLNVEKKQEQANMYQKAGDYSKAIGVLKELVGTAPTPDASVLTRIADFYVKNKNVIEGEKYLKEAEQLDNKMPYLYRTYAQLYIAKGDYKKAMESMDYSLKLADNDQGRFYGYMGLAQLNQMQQNFVDAKLNVEKALKIIPNEESAIKMMQQLKNPKEK